MRIAVLQEAATIHDVEANLGVIGRAAVKAAESGAGLLLTPELFGTGYDPVGWRAVAESDPDRARLLLQT